jgi:ABC-type polysaccharide/polyol phosphate export permease
MQGVLAQILLNIRLNFRNRMSLIYQYIFPTIFLIAFRTLYRGERYPLTLHLGELLTVTILGSTCFGLPTGIVSDRERGVWRRYKMLPVSAFSILGGTLVTRYLLVLTAGLVQVALAIAIGMPPPQHPLTLWAAFSLATIAFMGIGLDIAMLAPDVPAVQALGQSIFLPMLIVGGVAVPLANLPSWAQHMSAFLPGRYSVESIQTSVTGSGLAEFDSLLLIVIGAAGAAAGLLAFRWDSRQKPSPWIALALIGWVAAGLTAEWRDVVHSEKIEREERPSSTEFLAPPASPGGGLGTTPLSAPSATPPAAQLEKAPKTVAIVESPVKNAAGPATWDQVAQKDIDGVAFDRLPRDNGVVAPIAADDESADAPTVEQVEQLRAALEHWGPGKVADPVQRVRNLLYVASICDVFRIYPLERFVPIAVFDQINAVSASMDLPKILYFIALHPDSGGDSAARQIHLLGLPDAPADTRLLRNRNMLYAFKLLGRLTQTQDRK